MVKVSRFPGCRAVRGRDRRSPVRPGLADMSLLCALGRHRPRGIPRWNDGFYFATCERCGCDLVRTAYESWRVPKGYRIVWSDRPPASRPDVTLIPEVSAPTVLPAMSYPPGEPGPDAAPAAEAPPERAPDHPAPPVVGSPAPEPRAQPSGPSATDDNERVEAQLAADGAPKGRLPIQDVLAQLNAEDAASPARETVSSPAGRPARLRSTWDFMDDDPFDDDLPSGIAPRRAPESAVGTRPPPPADPAKEAGPSRRVGGVPEHWRKVRSAARNFFSGPAEPKPVLVIGLAFALAVAVAAATTLYWAGTSGPTGVSDIRGDGAESAENGEVIDPFAAASPEASAGNPELSAPQADVNDSAAETIAYVAASLLSCRTAPVLEAPRVRNLARGEEVRVLGQDGEWASLATRGGQCWARARFLSPVPPL
jgi:hypothetical protein